MLQRLAPTGVSCTPGRRAVHHDARAARRWRSVLDLLRGHRVGPGRAAVQTGARLLVLMTNDAWFNGSSSRSASQPIGLPRSRKWRAAGAGHNSGVTCAVDAVGQVRRRNQTVSRWTLTDFRDAGDGGGHRSTRPTRAGATACWDCPARSCCWRCWRAAYGGARPTSRSRRRNRQRAIEVIGCDRDARRSCVSGEKGSRESGARASPPATTCLAKG